MSYNGRYLQEKGVPKKKKGLKIFLSVLGILMSLVIVVVAVAFFYFRSKLDLITQVQYSAPLVEETGRVGYVDENDVAVWETETVPETTAAADSADDPAGETAATAAEEEKDRYINIMLIGQDGRKGEDSKMADSMILFSLNRETKELTLLSFLRDTILRAPNYGNHEFGFIKMNTYYALGYKWAGDKGAMDVLDLCVTSNFGVEIDGNVEVSFLDFVQIIDYMEGVQIELDENEVAYMNDISPRGESEEEYRVGLNELWGWEALHYVRMRHSSNSDSDFKRTERQRKMIMAVIDKISGLSLSEINDMVDHLMPLVKTDIEPSRIMSYILEVAPMLPSLKISSQQIPAEGTAHGEFRDIYQDGMQHSVLVPDVMANRRIVMRICEGVEIP